MCDPERWATTARPGALPRSAHDDLEIHEGQFRSFWQLDADVPDGAEQLLPDRPERLSEGRRRPDDLLCPGLLAAWSGRGADRRRPAPRLRILELPDQQLLVGG